MQQTQKLRLSGYNILSQEAFKWPSYKKTFLATSLKAQYVKSHVLPEWHAWDEAKILAKLDDMKEDLLKFVSVTMPERIALTTSVVKQINEVGFYCEDFEDKVGVLSIVNLVFDLVVFFSRCDHLSVRVPSILSLHFLKPYKDRDRRWWRRLDVADF